VHHPRRVFLPAAQIERRGSPKSKWLHGLQLLQTPERVGEPTDHVGRLT
jgi:hypothetical protein